MYLFLYYNDIYNILHHLKHLGGGGALLITLVVFSTYIDLIMLFMLIKQLFFKKVKIYLPQDLTLINISFIFTK